MLNIVSIIEESCRQNYDDINDYKNRLNLLKISQSPIIISAWKPKDEFHIGQYFCLQTLSNLLKCGSQVKIIIAQDPEDDLNIELKTSYTKAFIKYILPTSNTDTIQITLITDSKWNDDADIFSDFCQFSFLSNSEPETFVKKFKERNWCRNKNFINNLLFTLKNNFIDKYPNKKVFLVSGEKHVDIWESISSYLKMRHNINNFYPIYLSDILDSNHKAMNIKKQEKVFISFNQSSKIKIKEVSSNILDLSSSDNKEEADVYKRIIHQIIIPTHEKISNKFYENLQTNDEKVNYLTEFISKRVSTWINIKDELSKNINRVEINNTFLLSFLQNKFEIIFRDEFFTHNIEEIDIEPEKYRKDYQNLVHESYSYFINDAEFEGKESIKALIKSSTNIDVASYLMEKWHRDHYLHQFNVAALGEFFFSVFTRKGQTLLSEIDILLPKLGKDEIKYAWWTASLLHDHAYPIENLIKLFYKLQNLEKIYDIDNFSKSIFDAIESTSTLSGYFVKFFEKCIHEQASYRKLIFNDLDKFGKNIFEILHINTEFDHFDHAHLGIINICSIIGINNTDSAKSIFSRIPPWLILALKAILMHHGEKAIALSENPMAFLLILCDELQEWTRRQIYHSNGQDRFTHSIIKTTLGLRKHKDDFSFPKDLDICFICSNQEKLKRINWDYDTFLYNKKNNLDRLNLHNQRPIDNPQSIIYSINVLGP